MAPGPLVCLGGRGILEKTIPSLWPQAEQLRLVGIVLASLLVAVVVAILEGLGEQGPPHGAMLATVAHLLYIYI